MWAKIYFLISIFCVSFATSDVAIEKIQRHSRITPIVNENEARNQGHLLYSPELDNTIENDKPKRVLKKSKKKSGKKGTCRQMTDHDVHFTQH